MSWVRADAREVVAAEQVRVGVDCGSKTVKVVVVGGSDSIIYSSYLRHRTNIAETLKNTLADMRTRLGNFQATWAVTGSAGMRMSEALGMPFTQEVIATKCAVHNRVPDADAAIELGGEDSKILFLTGGEEARMNSSCAGGTGGFLDTMAGMLETNAYGMANMALEATMTYPIASRCCVFAQNDVRGLLNEGASKADIAASSLAAVVSQCVGGLACGRTIAGRVVFLGGPLHFLPPLAECFRKRLGLSEDDCIVPDDAHLYPALGAALSANRSTPARVDELAAAMRDGLTGLDDSIARLDPLFENDADLEAFSRGHHVHDLPRRQMWNVDGPLYLGVDSGSTSMKAVLVDGDGAVLWDYYKRNNGDTLTSAKRLLAELHRTMSAGRNAVGEGAWLARAFVTGYGEDILRKAFRMDGGVVETVAHLQAAMALRPDVDAVLDIGGQDIKWMRLRDGLVEDITLNEACSSGCGALLGGFAHNMQMSDVDFAREALFAKHPVDLGTRCTVFMTSRVRHAQKAGATAGDISAGLAYSVARNALYKVMNFNPAEHLGDNVMVSGGAFKSDALLRAFEKTVDQQVIRSDYPELMGAWGAALCAREADSGGRSTMIDAYKISTVQVERTTRRCALCGNACALSETVVTYDAGEQQVYNPMVAHRRDASAGKRAVLVRNITGNRCSRPLDEGNGSLARDGGTVRSEGAAQKPVNAGGATQGMANAGGATGSTNAPTTRGVDFTRQQFDRVFRRRAGEAPDVSPQRARTIGIPRALGMCDEFPFWEAFFDALGFEIRLSDPSSSALYRTGTPTVPSESACYPVKLLHGHVINLLDAGVNAKPNAKSNAEANATVDAKSNAKVDAIFWPRRNNAGAAEDGFECPVATDYALVVENVISRHAKSIAQPPRRLVSPILSPLESAGSNEANTAALVTALTELDKSITHEAVKHAIDAGTQALAAFRHELADLARAAISHVEATGGTGVVLACRPYHLDPEVNHGLPDVLGEWGLSAISSDAIWALCCEDAREFSHGSPDLGGNNGWRLTEREHIAAEWATRHPAFELMHLYSFGCGVDATAIDSLRHLCASNGRVFSAFKIDEMIDMASTRIRVRSLLYALDQRKRRSLASESPRNLANGASSEGTLGEHEPASTQKGPANRASEGSKKPATASDTARKNIMLVDWMPTHTPPLAKALESCGWHVYTTANDSGIATGLAITDNDACHTVLSSLGLIARETERMPQAEIALVPYECPRCCSRMTAAMLKGALGESAPRVMDIPQLLVASTERTDTSFGEFAEGDLRSLANALIAGDLENFRRCASTPGGDSSVCKTVGIAGSAPLALSPRLNNDLFGVIEQERAWPVPPSLTTQVIHATQVLAKEAPPRWAARLDNFARLCEEMQTEAFAREAENMSARQQAALVATSYAALRQAAAKHGVDENAQGGMGWLGPASMMALAEAGVRTILFAQTFACLGSHVSGLGAFHTVRAAFPDVNLGSVEYDSGISEVNQLNRIKLLISQAQI